VFEMKEGVLTTNGFQQMLSRRMMRPVSIIAPLINHDSNYVIVNSKWRSFIGMYF